jgi:hypothetical protein
MSVVRVKLPSGYRDLVKNANSFHLSEPIFASDADVDLFAAALLPADDTRGAREDVSLS